MKTQLMLAIKSGRYDEVLTLINSVEGEDRLELINDASESTGLLPACNALEMACLGYNIRIIETLIANGAIVDSMSLGNTTPLMMAVQSGNEQVVKLLLDKGADLQLRNQQGFTAIDIADIYDKPWISEGLRSRWLKLYKQPYVGPVKPKAS